MIIREQKNNYQKKEEQIESYKFGVHEYVINSLAKSDLQSMS